MLYQYLRCVLYRYMMWVDCVQSWSIQRSFVVLVNFFFQFQFQWFIASKEIITMTAME